MFCPHCGKENPDNSIFCQHCDGWILGEKYIEPTPEPVPAEPEPEAEETPSPAPKKKWWIPCAIGGVVLIVALAFVLIWSPWKTEKDYVVYANSSFAFAIDGKAFAVQGNTVVPLDISAASADSITCLDGSVGLYYLMGNSNTLCLLRDQKSHILSTNAIRCELSVNGAGVLYQEETNSGYSLYFQDTSMETEPVLLLMQQNPLSFAISPDGKTAAYTVHNPQTGKQDLMYFDGSNSQCIASSDQMALAAMANDGTAFYTFTRQEITIYRLDQAPITLPYNIDVSLQLYLNADHTQLLYFDEKETWMYDTRNHSQTKLCDDPVFPVTPTDAKTMYFGYHVTCPYYDLSGHVFMGMNSLFSSFLEYGHPLWYVNGNQTRRISEKATACQFDSTMTYLYYTDHDETLWVANLKKTNEEPVKLAEKVDRFLVTSDCKYVYYTSYFSLYCCSGKDGSGVTELNSLGPNNLTYFTLNQADILYYAFRDTIYACKNGKAVSLEQYPYASIVYAQNGFVYFTDDRMTHAGTEGDFSYALYETVLYNASGDSIEEVGLLTDNS